MPRTGLVRATQLIDRDILSQARLNIIDYEFESLEYKLRDTIARTVMDGKQYFVKVDPRQYRRDFVERHQQLTKLMRMAIIAYVNPTDCEIGDTFINDRFQRFEEMGELMIAGRMFRFGRGGWERVM